MSFDSSDTGVASQETGLRLWLFVLLRTTGYVWLMLFPKLLLELPLPFGVLVLDYRKDTLIQQQQGVSLMQLPKQVQALDPLRFGSSYIDK
jgi:hypothetical protein